MSRGKNPSFLRCIHDSIFSWPANGLYILSVIYTSCHFIKYPCYVDMSCFRSFRSLFEKVYTHNLSKSTRSYVSTDFAYFIIWQGLVWSSQMILVTKCGPTFCIECSQNQLHAFLLISRPAPTVLWHRNGHFPTRGKHHLKDNNYTLVISDADFTDQGQYECQGTNTYGKSTHISFQLLVHG